MSLHILRKGSDARLSSSFRLNEFDCTCNHPECDDTIVDSNLISLLQIVRDRLNQPLHITSGFRCAKRQEELRAMNLETARGISCHELGLAADFKADGKTGEELALVASMAGFRAIGVGPHWIHVDLRDDRDRRWTYK